MPLEGLTKSHFVVWFHDGDDGLRPRRRGGVRGDARYRRLIAETDTANGATAGKSKYFG